MLKSMLRMKSLSVYMGCDLKINRAYAFLKYINSYMLNGVPHHYHLMKSFVHLRNAKVCFIFISLRIEILVNKQWSVCSEYLIISLSLYG